MIRIIRNNKSQGATLVMAIVLLTIYMLMLGGIINLVMSQNKQTIRQISWERSLAIAEAGANFSRWRLVHDSNDFSFSGTYDYSDPQGGVIGQYSLEITEPVTCTTMVTVKSTGWTLDFPNVKRTVKVRYNRASLAQYAFLTNSDIWIGENEDVQGPLHSNGGVRMDGTQNAESTSSKETYTCQPMHGCNPATQKPGIWGSGSGGASGLWRFPVSVVDFNVITTDLADLKTKAQNGGYYFEPSGAFGYHIIFKNTGAFDLYKVTELEPDVWGCDTEWNCAWDSNDIKHEELVDRYDLAEDQCDIQNLIFVEDKKVWVDGVLKEKATVAAAQFPDTAATNSSIIINGNITRADPADTMLGLIAQKNVLVPYYSPNILEIQAVMVAQKGAVQRLYYAGNVKNKILVRGSIITNNVWTWSWVNGGGTVVSGYELTESHFEPALIYAPPPFFPGTGEYNFISWEELPQE
ncbi:MAG: hypothetical protein PHH01_01630 [Patescibacteria group bacterium]|nr:hypothetical protein [Patescibacteria group bacterium]MDD5566872.1 hypothetical protein [Patescibacteria group bacterium]